MRIATNFLSAARQIEVFSGVTAADVNLSTTRPSPPVGSSWTDSLEGTIGVATHHDGMSGTERQSVANDYSQRISESHFEVEAGVALSLQKLSGSTAPFGHCNCNSAGNCLNLSVCAYTTGVDNFAMVAWNPQGQSATQMVRIPVTGDQWEVVDADGKLVLSQTAPIDDRTLSLPLLYINKYKMSSAKLNATITSVQNNATHILTFSITMPPVGYTTYSVKQTTDNKVPRTTRQGSIGTVVTRGASNISNEFYSISFDQATGRITGITNRKSGKTSPLDIDWGYYVSSEGGSTWWMNGTKLQEFKSNQASGAYLFRPVNQTTADVTNGTNPTLEVVIGPIVSEIRQTFSDYASHVVRLTRGLPYVEVEWTAGPIPGGLTELPPLPAPGGCVGWKNTKNCDPHGPRNPSADRDCNATLDPKGDSGYCLCAGGVKVYGDGCGGPSGDKNCNDACNRPVPQFANPGGKEVVLKFNTDLNSDKVFYTDSNGREMVKRIRDGRGPSYPPLQINEPVAENYYPVNSLMSLDDGETEMAIVTDVAMGGSSMADGSLEIMVHRRLQHDDSRGVQEPLNETMCGCNDIGAAPGSMGAHGHEGDGGCACAGLTVRGSTYMVFDTVTGANAARRQLIESLNFPATLAFAPSTSTMKNLEWSGVSSALPAEIKLMTLTSNYEEIHDGALLLRLAHIYSVDEHPTMSLPISVDLSKVFGKTGFTIKTATEMTVTANQPKSNFKPFNWPTEDPTGGRMYKSDNAFEESIPLDGFTTTLRPMEVKTFLVTLG